ncbi:hypothetical protein HYX70_04785 [Candidatus Saccharibacteria bacterium]|nr:hypothetical protein [Candidatus Saccharibacteria bacterium]
MSPLKLIALFVLVFCVSAFLLLLIVKITHFITKDHTNNYWLAIAVFSALLAAMVVYTNLGR